MALGLKASVANSILDGTFNNGTPYDGPAAVYIQLHTAAPGAAGTTAVATNNTRKAITHAAASSGSIATNADVTWTSVPATETYTHFSLWDASTAGNFLGSGTVTANAVTSGDTFVIPSGSETITANVAT